MMISSSLAALIQKRLSDYLGSNNEPTFQRIGGGSINDTFKVSWGDQKIFCKINSAHKFPQLFEKEAAGLRLIEKKSTLRTPGVIDCFESGDDQVLLLEWIEEGARTTAFWKKFGEQLSALHSVRASAFGLEMNNYMGSVEQSNLSTGSWTEFFREQRLRPMIEKCVRLELLSPGHEKKFGKLFGVLSSIFDGAQQPALVHGDLWSGNFMCDDLASPVLIDPAVYYGHPTVDMAMTTLFGGFASEFYEAYNYHSPFPSNYKEQWMICNLYPLLIHLFLFGRSYLSQIERALEKF